MNASVRAAGSVLMALLWGALPLADCLAAEAAPPASAAPAEKTALDYVTTYPDKQCDSANIAWAVRNDHNFLSIEVKLRWAAVGGHAKEETFVLSPSERRAVGCAPTVEILSATLMQF